jgi:phosphoribosyl 1,2-cyclic phosphodiesterase
VKATFWGTRGSQATPGPDTVRYGGNTSCVSVGACDDAVVVLDAGTGIRRLGLHLDDAVRRVDVLLTHLHMDHIQGLGFFTALFRDDLEVHLWGPASASAGLRARLARYLSPPLFPVRLDELPCALHVHDVDERRFELPGLTVQAGLVCHPGATVGYRLDAGDATLAYVPDHEPALACPDFAALPAWCSGFDLAAGADVLVHDAQYDDHEYAARMGWGHSTLAHALAFARVTQVKRLVPFHHDPGHDDDRLDARFSDLGAGDDTLAVVPAREGLVVDVPATDA